MKTVTWSKTLPSLVLMGIFVGAIVMGCTAGNRAQAPVSRANGDVQRTFAEPLPRVSTATLSALDRMGIKVEAQEKTEKRQVIKAKTENLDVEVRLDAISPTSTRMQAVAKEGVLSKDTATATEIVLQTEKAIHGDWSFWQ
jgi:hypothetical protein